MKRIPENIEKEFFHGISQFNDRQFFDCHETLEEVWNQYLETDRELIQGIIQIAVGYYHLGRKNFSGASKLFKRGLPRVSKYGREHFGLALTNFVAKVEADLKLLESAADLSDSANRQFQIPIIEIISPLSDC